MPYPAFRRRLPAPEDYPCAHSPYRTRILRHGFLRLSSAHSKEAARPRGETSSTQMVAWGFSPRSPAIKPRASRFRSAATKPFLKTRKPALTRRLLNACPAIYSRRRRLASPTPDSSAVPNSASEPGSGVGLVVVKVPNSPGGTLASGPEFGSSTKVVAFASPAA